MNIITDQIGDFQPYYQDADCVIYHADCRQVLPFLGSFDLLLTDPPYGIDSARHRSSQKDGWRDYGTVCDASWDKEPPPSWVIDMIRAAATGSIIWGGNYFDLPPSQGWLFWDKGQRDFSLADGEMAWTSFDRAIRVFDYPRAKALKDGKVHPTQKPLALMQWCLGLCKDAQTILDTFMGSGTTLVAAKLEGRRSVGIEINEKYCESAAKRLEQGVLF